ncbi:hypothetical protein PG994_006578 [Apiospora phragmitis]|uniref:Uncharacterized protein n=1 Tax=Apiospora phragmitis TaxID=2905665 RepID=A0ABR1VFG6_9PEZI
MTKRQAGTGGCWVDLRHFSLRPPSKRTPHFGTQSSDYMQLHFGQRLSVILLLFLPALYGGIHLSA